MSKLKFISFISNISLILTLLFIVVSWALVVFIWKFQPVCNNLIYLLIIVNIFMKTLPSVEFEMDNILIKIDNKLFLALLYLLIDIFIWLFMRHFDISFCLFLTVKFE